MALEKTEAIILKSFNWSESSRTVVFFTRDHGLLALVDRGGRSLKARRGRLMPFARLEITFYSSQRETRGYISEVDLVEAFTFEKDGTLGRLAYASAACELLKLLLPEEDPLEDLYRYFLSYLKSVDLVDKTSLPGIFIAFFLRLLSQLGYHPSLAFCSVCGRSLEGLETSTGNGRSEVAFYPEQGGLVCASCQSPGDYYIPLTRLGLDRLLALQRASLSEAAEITIGYNDAAGLLEALARFLNYQTGLNTDLKSLDFLEKLASTRLTD